MIITLTKGRAIVKTMEVPEPANNTYIQYQFEPGTNHLHPKLFINGRVFEGDRSYVDLGVYYPEKELSMVVDLIDTGGAVIARYTAKVPYYVYHLVGKKPMRPDLALYVATLEARIRELEELGEVI